MSKLWNRHCDGYQPEGDACSNPKPVLFPEILSTDPN